MNTNYRMLTISYKQDINYGELKKIRGAFIQKASNNPFFHNHNNDQLHYRYPLIQYKCINRKPMIVAYNEACEALFYFIENPEMRFDLGHRKLLMSIDKVGQDEGVIELVSTSHKYTLKRWLPLNQQRFEEYRREESIITRYAMLEKILTGNILSFLKGMGIWVEETIECHISKVMEIAEPVDFKGVPFLAFEIEFVCNYKLPDYIGLGKGVSLGFGTVYSSKK